MTSTTHTEPENLDRAAIRELQIVRLRALLAEVVRSNAFWSQKYAAAGIDPISDVLSLDDLAKLPLTTKSEIVEDQSAQPPYGTNLTYPPARYSRLHQTSGTTGQPLRWLDTPNSWNWFMECWAQIYRIVGLRNDDRLAFPFSFGPFIGFWGGFEGAQRLGRFCLPGGGMSSEARLRLIEDNRATVICCTPTYALRLAEVAEAEGIALAEGSVRALVVAGEPGGSIPATRSRIESAWGARVFDHWGMTEIGALAIECEQNPAAAGLCLRPQDSLASREKNVDARLRAKPPMGAGGLHVLESECIAEILDPNTLEPVEPPELGELVLTNLGRTGSPLIRYRTGDLVQADVQPCPCGRSLLRLKGGIHGRYDDMVSIRGNNVFPSTIEAIVREFDSIAEFRVEVFTQRSMEHLRIEVEPAGDVKTADRSEALADRVRRAIRNRLNFQAEVVVVEPGSLPRFELKGRRFFRRTS